MRRVASSKGEEVRGGGRTASSLEKMPGSQKPRNDRRVSQLLDCGSDRDRTREGARRRDSKAHRDQACEDGLARRSSVDEVEVARRDAGDLGDVERRGVNPSSSGGEEGGPGRT